MGITNDEHSDRLIESALLTCAGWHVEHGTPYDEAVEDLRMMADGRCDLLGHLAGMVMGEYAADPSSFSPCDVRAIAMLVEAGADAAPLVHGFLLGHGGHERSLRARLRERRRSVLARAHGPVRSV